MGWYEAFKDLLAVADRLRDAELKHKLADVQMEGARLAEENARLRQELIALQEQVRTRQEMQYRDNVYWRQAGQGEREGPFCPKCLDGDGKPARMSDRADDDCWRCPVCRYVVMKPGRSHRQIRAKTKFDPFKSF